MEIYTVAETFHSLQGEGAWTGQAAFFIRLSGCNLDCNFCDTKFDVTRSATAAALIQEAKQYPTNRIVLTGGEPTLQPIGELIEKLRRQGYRVHLETNGTQPVPPEWKLEWIAVSPKTTITKLDKLTMLSANEVKFLCNFVPYWEDYIEMVVNTCTMASQILWLMPIAKGWRQSPNFKRPEELNRDNIDLAIDYCGKNPHIRLCMQMHKVVNIR